VNIFKIVGKYLDQPILVSKFEKKVPYLLAGGGGLYTAHCVKHSEPEKKNETLLRCGTTMVFTALSALSAPKIVNKIFKNPTKTLKQIKNSNTELIDNFVKDNKINTKSKEIYEDYFHNTLALEKLPQEYPTFGHGDLRHGALDIEDAFGGNVLDLSYVSHEILSGKPALPGLPASFDQQGESKTLSLVLADQKLGLTITSQSLKMV